LISAIPADKGNSFARHIRAGALVAALVWFGSGCLYIPTPHGKAVEGTEVTLSDLAFLRPGETSKEEVTRKLGSPTILWRDENIFVYRWVKQRGVLLWAVASGYSGSFGLIDVPQEFAFLLTFDRNDIFVNSETLEKPVGKAYGDFLLEWRDAQRARNWQAPPKTP